MGKYNLWQTQRLWIKIKDRLSKIDFFEIVQFNRLPVGAFEIYAWSADDLLLRKMRKRVYDGPRGFGGLAQVARGPGKGFFSPGHGHYAQS